MGGLIRHYPLLAGLYDSFGRYSTVKRFSKVLILQQGLAKGVQYAGFNWLTAFALISSLFVLFSLSRFSSWPLGEPAGPN